MMKSLEVVDTDSDQVLVRSQLYTIYTSILKHSESNCSSFSIYTRAMKRLPHSAEKVSVGHLVDTSRPSPKAC